MRKTRAPIRPVTEDPVYKHKLVTKLINRSMRDGKRSVAQAQVYDAFERIRQTGQDPVAVFIQAMENVRPSMEVRPRRIGGAAYQVPMPVRGVRKDALAIRWIIQAANSLPNSQYHTFGHKLATEIMNAATGQGGALTKKVDIERQAEANKAFAHFRW